MLLADVLNSDFALNSFDVINTLPFVPGEDITFAIRLKQSQRKDLLRFIPPSTTILTATFNLKDGTTQDVTMTALTDDRSIWSCPLDETLTGNLAGGNVILTVDLLGNGSKITKAFVQNALSIVITGIC